MEEQRRREKEQADREIEREKIRAKEREEVGKLHGMKRLKHLVPEIGDVAEEDVDFSTLLPRIFKTVRRRTRRSDEPRERRKRGVSATNNLPRSGDSSFSVVRSFFFITQSPRITPLR